MAALGRIFLIVGFIWLFAALFGEEFGLPPLGILPAIVFIFLGRALRRQARRRASDETLPDQPQTRVETPEPVERPLNTERQQTPLPPPPPPRVARTPEPDAMEEVSERNELLEKILASDDALKRSGPKTTPDADKDHKPLKTSAEMIAEARKRWDRKD